MGTSDLGPVFGIAIGASVAAGLLGAVLLRLSRRRSITISLAIVVLTAVIAMFTGTAIASAMMFLSQHDMRLVLVVIAVTGVVSLAIAVVLGRTLVTGSRALGLAAREIGDGSVDARPPSPPTAELGSLAKALADADRRLAEARERERGLERGRRELIAWMSHDLRTPLAGLRAMAEALSDGVVAHDRATVARYHARILVEVDRLSEMVDDLFELSRVTAGAPDPCAGRVSLSDLVSDTLASATPVAKARGIRLDGHADADTPAVIGSASDLARALGNLVANALRHTPPGGAVLVWAAASRRNDSDNPGGGELAVEDGCGGIPDGDLPRVFDVAFRGSAPRTPESGSGAGLGLAITRAIAEAHGGEVGVVNVSGGCRFTLRLPAARGARDPGPAPAVHPPTAHPPTAPRNEAVENSSIPSPNSTSA